MKKTRLAFLLLLWAGGTGVAAAMPGCYGRNCEGDQQTFGIEQGEGRMLDDATWESSPQVGKWLSFPRQRVWHFDIRALGGRTPQVILPYVSASEDPYSRGQSATIGGGNLAEIYNVRENFVSVRNGTCSDYYLRLVINVADRPPETESDAAISDGSTADVAVATDAAADANDAGTDAEAGP